MEQRPHIVPQDDPFMERLFAAMCRNVPALPGDTFVDEARRWIAALNCAASLKPRDQAEWLQAADVATQQFFAVYSLVMQQLETTTSKQRLKHAQNFVLHQQAMRDARHRYDLLRKSRAA